MGALSKPMTEKDSDSFQNSELMVGSSAMQGWRLTMEDVRLVCLNPDKDPEACVFGIFDGHNGRVFASLAASNVYDFILQNREYSHHNVPEAIRKGFQDFDESLQENPETKDNFGGTTANVVIMKSGHIYCGNAGDSRAVACIKGAPYPLSIDHKPKDQVEKARIEAAGGSVKNNWINGDLNVSRGFGDFRYKRNSTKSAPEQMLTAQPDVKVKKITAGLEFIIMGSDGIWEMLSNEAAVEFVKARLGNGMEPVIICEELLDRCMNLDRPNGLGADNKSAVLVCLLHGKSWAEYCLKFGTAVEPSDQGTSIAEAAGGSEATTDGVDPDEMDASGDAELPEPSEPSDNHEQDAEQNSEADSSAEKALEEQETADCAVGNVHVNTPQAETPSTRRCGSHCLNKCLLQ